MIPGEEYWTPEFESQEEYDLFFKKLGSKIRQTTNKMKSNDRFKKLGGMFGLGPRLITRFPRKIIQRFKQKGNTQTSKGNSPSPNLIAKAIKNKEASLLKNQSQLQQAQKDFEQKKLEELNKIKQQKAALEQAAIDNQHGDSKQMLYIGLIGLSGIVVIGGIIWAIKHKPNQA